MKLTKENVCVFIENESQLQFAKEILKKYGESIANDGTFELTDEQGNYLQLFKGDYKWCLLTKWKRQITISKLEEILKNEAK